MTFAIVSINNKQYKITTGDIIAVTGNIGEIGQAIAIEKVLLTNTQDDVLIGNPILPNVSVMATVIEHSQNKKIIIVKKKRRKNHQRTRGYRDILTYLKITDIKIV